VTNFIVVIPVRMESARLPGKPLADIGGRPMIAWVAQRANASLATEVIVATDSEHIKDACQSIGVAVEMTSSSHQSGTDRIAELARRREWSPDQIIINVQGDEPLLPPELINQVADLLSNFPTADIATLQTPLVDLAEFQSRNNAKVISDQDGWALYFSRAPIPAAAAGQIPTTARRHIGLYAYRCASLLSFAAAKVCDLEEFERLEQLRALWIGQRIVVADAVSDPPRGVDTAEDLDVVRAQAERESIEW
jgi:3-deoxy-manno-octulosonate cytidylyltransferase (CMP-KDO synthetase)